MAASSKPPEIMSAVRDLDATWLEELVALASTADRRELRRGDVLVRQGEPADTLYFVLSGRFSVHLQGVPQPIAEIAQGQPIGEVGFFAGLPRTATVIALRDSHVLAITREQFQALAAASPRMHEAVIASLAGRLSTSIQSAPGSASPVRTVAIVWAGGSPGSSEFLQQLGHAANYGSRSVILHEQDVSARLRGRSLDHPEISGWLNSLEAEFDLVFYIAGRTLGEWTKKCIRQADTVLLVGMAGASVELNACEQFALSIHARPARRLVMLHKSRGELVSGTAEWLQTRDVFMHHHAAVEDGKDLMRLLRFLSGRAVGFVAGGGGALGSAHLGVYKAFREAGVEFDILGGSSVGAAMTAGLAYGVDPERVNEGTHNIFVKSRSFRRYNFPLYGILDHTVFDRALQAEYRDVLIEDLWQQYFALSSNLSRHRPEIHRHGPVWQAVRASGSVPGLLPPFFTEQGEMLVDGGLMDNIPLAPMKALKAGPNVIVMLAVEEPVTYPVAYQAIPGLRDFAIATLNPFSRHPLPPAPNLLQVIMLSMTANRRTDVPAGPLDVLVKPRMPDGVRFTSWERHNEIFEQTYQDTLRWIDARMAECDPQLQALLQPRAASLPGKPDAVAMVRQ